MRIGIIGAGHIGGNCARPFILGGEHEMKLSFSRNPAKLAELAQELGEKASVGPLKEAFQFGDIVVLSARRRGAVYGEEYRLSEALEVLAARAGRPNPPVPRYV